MAHQHNHHHSEQSWGRRLIVTMVMNLIIPAVQIYGGIVSGSMALISDALHNLSDFTAVLLSYAALRVGGRGPSLQQTFGYKRVEVFATFLNVALLYGVAFFIAIEAGKRLLHPEPIEGLLVVWIALIGFIGNMISTLMLQSGAKVNMNMKSAFLHMLTDALTSLGVAALGVVWIFKPWYWLDPVVSWLIVGMILYGGWGLLKESYFILMNATPPGIDLRAIQAAIESVEGVKEIHHLHVWNTSAESIALAAHITVADQMLSSLGDVSIKVRDLLLCRFRIDHPILQFEAAGCAGCEASGLISCPIVRTAPPTPEN
ncbi:MAG: cation diffusion facilitator family transporter [Syntrophales bacterium]|nr:cation diffusion facilitator family transporter [Syntrophales bacterium]